MNLIIVFVIYIFVGLILDILFLKINIYPKGIPNPERRITIFVWPLVIFFFFCFLIKNIFDKYLNYVKKVFDKTNQ